MKLNSIVGTLLAASATAVSAGTVPYPKPGPGGVMSVPSEADAAAPVAPPAAPVPPHGNLPPKPKCSKCSNKKLDDAKDSPQPPSDNPAAKTACKKGPKQSDGDPPGGSLPGGPSPNGKQSESHLPGGPLPSGPSPDGVQSDRQGPLPDGPLPDGPLPDGPLPDGAQSGQLPGAKIPTDKDSKPPQKAECKKKPSESGIPSTDGLPPSEGSSVAPLGPNVDGANNSVQPSSSNTDSLQPSGQGKPCLKCSSGSGSITPPGPNNVNSADDSVQPSSDLPPVANIPTDDKGSEPPKEPKGEKGPGQLDSTSSDLPPVAGTTPDIGSETSQKPKCRKRPGQLDNPSSDLPPVANIPTDDKGSEPPQEPKGEKGPGQLDSPSSDLPAVAGTTPDIGSETSQKPKCKKRPGQLDSPSSGQPPVPITPADKDSKPPKKADCKKKPSESGIPSTDGLPPYDGGSEGPNNVDGANDSVPPPSDNTDSLQPSGQGKPCLKCSGGSGSVTPPGPNNVDGANDSVPPPSDNTDSLQPSGQGKPCLKCSGVNKSVGDQIPDAGTTMPQGPAVPRLGETDDTTASPNPAVLPPKEDTASPNPAVLPPKEDTAPDSIPNRFGGTKDTETQQNAAPTAPTKTDSTKQDQAGIAGDWIPIDNVTPHVQYSSSVGVLGCKIDHRYVAYWPSAVDCNDICIQLKYGEGEQARSVFLLKVDVSGGANDISAHAWKELMNTETLDSGKSMQYRNVAASQCSKLIKTGNGKLPLSAANSMNFVGGCVKSKPESWVAKNYELYNIADPRCANGIDEPCTINLATGQNQATCANGLGSPAKEGVKIANALNDKE